MVSVTGYVFLVPAIVEIKRSFPMTTYRAALIGCSRMGAFIDNELPPDNHRLPYAHAAAYAACDRTDLIALADIRSDVMAQAGHQYHVSEEKQYLNYKEMIDEEQPDIVSIATQPEQRAEIAIYAAEHGVRAIYAEKALSASLEEADAIRDAVERHKVLFNMGTNRRWHDGYDAMIEVIQSDRLGALKTVISHMTGTLFNTSSHIFDLLFRLNEDHPVAWAQAHLPDDDEIFDGDVLCVDPGAHGMFQFDNGVMAYCLNSGRGLEVEAVCEHGTVTALNNDEDWEVREPIDTDDRGRNKLGPGPFPDFERRSSTLNLVKDLVHALDTGEPTRGGIHLAHTNMELIYGFVESHIQGGARVDLPLAHRTRRLHRHRTPRDPKYQR
jgi:predicted dehydrogenase